MRDMNSCLCADNNFIYQQKEAEEKKTIFFYIKWIDFFMAFMPVNYY